MAAPSRLSCGRRRRSRADRAKDEAAQACLAWYEALADQGDWTAALKACDAAARMVRQSPWRGELLDEPALAV
jgi:hypothetical protein